MPFVADFHVHSRYSRATARNLDLENLFLAAQLKGVAVVGTGDFTHPGWFSQITDKLIQEEGDLLVLHPKRAAELAQQIPPRCRRPVKFMLVTEISNIYKREGRTRKNHNLVFFPTIESASRFSKRLSRLGNVESDGRPILGLDAHDLLELTLDTCSEAFLIPAHIWTPWFSLFGSKSGFENIEECFRELAGEIFALETGLSSDPPMNWRVSGLDRFTLISNSDAHSPMKLAREANRFASELSFHGIRNAIRHPESGAFLGTIEFFPEEGKYHLDGHRQCDVRVWPKNDRGGDDRCPKCGKDMTIGVLHRVEEMADRPAGFMPVDARPFERAVPLIQILAELAGAGPESKGVQRLYSTALSRLGPELEILLHLPEDRIAAAGIALLDEAIRRMRAGRVQISPGYDGEYGTIRIFSDAERQNLGGQRVLFEGSSVLSAHLSLVPPPRRETPLAPPPRDPPRPPEEFRHHGMLNDAQWAATDRKEGNLLITAGPGTGKTRTLTHAIARRMIEEKIPAGDILALTFTNHAAGEMRDRLKRLLPVDTALPRMGTFHAICRSLLVEGGLAPPVIATRSERMAAARDALRMIGQEGKKSTFSAAALLRDIDRAKQALVGPDDDLQGVFPGRRKEELEELGRLYRWYRNILSVQQRGEFEDLIGILVDHLERRSALGRGIVDRVRWLYIDEYQDLNQSQYRLLRALWAGARQVVAIGDPDQSIYGLRGSDPTYFARFSMDCSPVTTIRLQQNYRSTETILQAARQVLSPSAQGPGCGLFSGIQGHSNITLLERENELGEAGAVAKTIGRLIGGTGYHSRDSDGIDPGDDTQWGFADFAVLFRTREQANLLGQEFTRAGVPWQMVSRHPLFEGRIAQVLATFRAFEGCGGFEDLETVCRRLPFGIRAATLTHFKNWCLESGQTLTAAIEATAHCPIPGLSRLQQEGLVHTFGQMVEWRRQTRDLPVCERLVRLMDTPQLSLQAQDIPVGGDDLPVWDRIQKVAEEAGAHTDLFLASLNALEDTDLYQQRAQRVSLMTMHSAKGIEFPIVFICGCEDGLIPFHREGKHDGNPEEERRLFYVAVTRARERLYLTRARRRVIHGRLVSTALSPFVVGIDAVLCRPEKESCGRRIQKQLPLF